MTANFSESGLFGRRRSTALPLDTDAATAIGINHFDIDRRQAPVGTAMTDPPRKSTSEEGARDEPRRPFDECGNSRASQEKLRALLCVPSASSGDDTASWLMTVSTPRTCSEIGR